jgi:hypothetical protein
MLTHGNFEAQLTTRALPGNRPNSLCKCVRVRVLIGRVHNPFKRRNVVAAIPPKVLAWDECR